MSPLFSLIIDDHRESVPTKRVGIYIDRAHHTAIFTQIQKNSTKFNCYSLQTIYRRFRALQSVRAIQGQVLRPECEAALGMLHVRPHGAIFRQKQLTKHITC